MYCTSSEACSHIPIANSSTWENNKRWVAMEFPRTYECVCVCSDVKSKPGVYSKGLFSAVTDKMQLSKCTSEQNVNRPDLTLMSSLTHNPPICKAADEKWTTLHTARVDVHDQIIKHSWTNILKRLHYFPLGCINTLQKSLNSIWGRAASHSAWWSTFLRFFGFWLPGCRPQRLAKIRHIVF